MGNAAEVGADGPPGSGAFERGEIGLIGVDHIRQEMIVQGAVAHGHFDGPDFVHPEAEGGDPLEAEESCGEENYGDYGEIAVACDGGLGHIKKDFTPRAQTSHDINEFGIFCVIFIIVVILIVV